MASIFTFQEEPPRVHSPWSTPGQSTPQKGSSVTLQHASDGSFFTSITRLEPERHDGPTEYKLHLLLRSRRNFSVIPAHITNASADSTRNSSSESINGLASTLAASVAISPQPTTYSRQARLQQLTTQLLWRLQQSSPFHSSSNVSLVLPVLPEATPRLGVPDRPAKLLPGLEESQGALYEIGVADDGTLVGLLEDELEESLTNLRAMAASLGCVVDILRRVIVGQHEYEHDSNQSETAKLWVAEVLVKPDARSREVPKQTDPQDSLSGLAAQSLVDEKVSVETVEQIRIAVLGASAAGKSSLVGTLTTSKLDNGRGKSRLSLLKHRHEIASGVTSSVAQELLGYCGATGRKAEVINYASGNVSSWPDIHNLSKRLVFLSDSPGQPRYAKSTFRTLISWKPHWTMFCVPADAEDGSAVIPDAILGEARNSGSIDGVDSREVSLAHLVMCLKMRVHLAVVVTKMDNATKTGLKTILAKVLSILKDAGRIPILLGSSSAVIKAADDSVDVAAQLSCMTESEHTQVKACLEKIQDHQSSAGQSYVPIILSSAVTGAGFGKLHHLLKELPINDFPQNDTRFAQQTCKEHAESLFHIDETFAIPPSKVYYGDGPNQTADQGIVLCGHVAGGSIAVGDKLRLGPFWIEQVSSTEEGDTNSPSGTSRTLQTGRPSLQNSFSGMFSKSLQGEQIKISSLQGEYVSAFIDVLVVSLRSLRLPVRSMSLNETGTVGVQPLGRSSPVLLSRARKGMVLTSISVDQLSGYKSFKARFAASEFAGLASPPLILGGHAIVYLNSVRAAVKVTAVDLSAADSLDSSSPVEEVFDFDGDTTTNILDSSTGMREIRVSFQFVSSVEWFEEGTRVLVIPNVAAAGPVSGPPSVAITGLSGFVGKVSDVYT